jgi:hypothetical protein
LATTYRPPYHQGKAIPDPTLLDHLASFPYSLDNEALLEEEYCDQFYHWIRSSTLCVFEGLENFTNRCYTQGTTECFDKWYIRHASRRHRIWRGEYAYHSIMFQSGLSWAWLDDEPIQKGDAVILSLPFADSGSAYKLMDTLTACEQLEVPVLLDFCWFGTCEGIGINLNLECIQEVTFSLSKCFPLSRFRCGIRLAKREYAADGLQELKRAQYLNYHSQRLAMWFMRDYSPDWIVHQYRATSRQLCDSLGVQPSASVCLATGGADWKHLNRGGPHNRLCLSGELVARSY